MKRTLTFLVIAATTCLIGTAVTRVFFSWDVRFQLKGVGSMGMCEEGLGGFSSFESYDGEKLFFMRIRFPSDAAAEDCFQSTIRAGINVVGRENLFDETQTRIVGERIIGKIGLNGRESAFVLARDQDDIIEIASTSLRHALIFEKQARKY